MVAKCRGGGKNFDGLVNPFEFEGRRGFS